MSKNRTWKRPMMIAVWTVALPIIWIALFMGTMFVEIYGQRHFGWKPLGQLFPWVEADWLLFAFLGGIPVAGVGSLLLALEGKLPGTSN